MKIIQSNNLGVLVSCGERPQTLFLIIKKKERHPASKIPSQSSQFAVLLSSFCVSAGLPICNGYLSFCQKADCQATEGADFFFSSLSTSVSWLLSQPHSPFIFLSPSSLPFVFILLRAKSKNTSTCLSLSLSFAFLFLLPRRSSHHPSRCLREKTKPS